MNGTARTTITSPNRSNGLTGLHPIFVLVLVLAFVHSPQLAAKSFNAGGTVLQSTDYYPFGSRTTFGASYATLSSNRQKFSGKEEQTAVAGSTLPYLDFGARMYDAKLVRWNTYDPMAEKYYGINPYAYCNGDPVNMVDPLGRKIVIASSNNQEVPYSVGMKYSGDDSFVANTVSTLNAIIENGGKKAINRLIDSQMKFVYDNSSYRSDLAYCKDGKIGIGAAFKNGYTFSESLELIAHESFHAVQEAEGQGETSIFNEVEAHVFGFIIQRNWLASTNTDSVQGVSQANAGRPNDAGRRYEEAFNSLTQSFSPMDMSSAVHNFKTGSSSNASGLYNNKQVKQDIY